ncbi:histidine phosphatase family protein [Leptospira kmetyi]|uniref:histidine phosphatase family protein n=1 Tax=Leptospira kmetyi TaxID=408139 RepID=UPI0002897397|nr:histidine phosphatase family protein [Leptospira kmetyi]EQA55759.1 histidine phosphatase superfamily (branch 1) [Leptospira kmetyi serovar Malaysia str. Bejo-Iso9]
METTRLINTFKSSNAIYVFRHGETEWNLQGKLQGHFQNSITENGIHQAKALIPILKNAKVEVLLSSDLQRAKETSRVVAEALNLPILFDPGFREIDLGEGQGKLISEVDSRFGESFWKRWNDHDPMYDSLRFPGGESKLETDVRIHSALTKRIEIFSERTVALCTHGYVMTRMLKMYKPEIQRIPHIQNGECIRFRVEDILRKERSLEKI